MPSLRETIPLLFEDDAYELIVEVTESHVSVLEILRFPNNENVNPTSEKFFDLTPDCRDAIVRQINRRHPKKTLRVR